jgi:hypothetical protein
MRTIQFLINQLQAYKPLKIFDASTILAFMEEEHRYLCNKYPILIQTTTINLVVGQQEYDLPSGTQVINSAVYRLAADQSYALTGVGYNSKFNHDPWVNQRQNDHPSEFYVRNGKIGLFPRPVAATDTGFPVVVTEAQVYAPLVPDGVSTSTSEIPETVPVASIYEFGTLRRALQRAAIGCDDKEAMLVSLQVAESNYKAATLELEEFLNLQNQQYKAKSQPRESDFPSSIS